MRQEEQSESTGAPKQRNGTQARPFSLLERGPLCLKEGFQAAICIYKRPLQPSLSSKTTRQSSTTTNHTPNSATQFTFIMGEDITSRSPANPATPDAIVDYEYEVVFAESEDNLPAPLPTVEAIKNAPGQVWGCGGTVVRLDADYFVKIVADPLEAHTQRYVWQHTNVRVPRVYAMYQRKEERGPITYIVMEAIAGDTVEKAWEDLDENNKTQITKQLHESLNSLRQLPNPGYFGSIEGTVCPDTWFTEKFPNHGPFATEDDFVLTLLRTFPTYDRRIVNLVEYFRRTLPQALRTDEAPTFTHGDLQPRNVMLQPDGKIAIVDWGTSGWYPAYWEYASMTWAWLRRVAEAQAYLAQMLDDEYPNHYAWYAILLTTGAAWELD